MKRLALLSCFLLLAGASASHAQDLKASKPLKYSALTPVDAPIPGGTKGKSWFCTKEEIFLVKEGGGYGSGGKGLSMDELGDLMAIREAMAGDIYKALLEIYTPTTYLVDVPKGTKAYLAGLETKKSKLIASQQLPYFSGLETWAGPQSENLYGTYAGFTSSWIMARLLGDTDTKTDNFGAYFPIGGTNYVACKIDHGLTFDNFFGSGDQWLADIKNGRVEISPTKSGAAVSFPMDPAEKAWILDRIKKVKAVQISTLVKYYETSYFANYRKKHKKNAIATKEIEDLVGTPENSVATELLRRVELVKKEL